MEYYSALKRERSPDPVTWMNPKTQCQVKEARCENHRLHETPREGKSAETGSSRGVPGEGGGWERDVGEGNACFMGMESPSGVREKFWN